MSKEACSNKLLYIYDESPKFALDNIKKAGIAIPVFSIRTERDTGCGEFTDIPLMAKLAKKSGFSIIQILPINDTTNKKTWL